MEKSKIRSQIPFLIIIAVLVIVLLVSGWRNFRKGIYVGDQFFYQISDTVYKRNADDCITWQNNGNNTEFTVTMGGEELSADIQWTDTLAVITYDDGTVSELYWDGQQLYDKDGFPLSLSVDIAVPTNREPVSINKDALSSAICMISQHQTERRGSSYLLIVGGILYLLGALTFFFPNESHFFLSRWAYRDAELSDAGIFMQKLSGIAIMVIGTILILGLFIY